MTEKCELIMMSLNEENVFVDHITDSSSKRVRYASWLLFIQSFLVIQRIAVFIILVYWVDTIIIHNLLL